jgi:hypothetical protein
VLEKDALEPRESLNLIETCTFVALLSNGQLVCTTGTFNGPLYVLRSSRSAPPSAALRGILPARPGERSLHAAHRAGSTPVPCVWIPCHYFRRA